MLSPTWHRRENSSFHVDGHFGGRTDGRTNGRADGRTDGRTGEWTEGQTGGRTDGWTGEQKDGRMGDNPNTLIEDVAGSPRVSVQLTRLVRTVDGDCEGEIILANWKRDDYVIHSMIASLCLSLSLSLSLCLYLSSLSSFLSSDGSMNVGDHGGPSSRRVD